MGEREKHTYFSSATRSRGLVSPGGGEGEGRGKTAGLAVVLGLTRQLVREETRINVKGLTSKPEGRTFGRSRGKNGLQRSVRVGGGGLDLNGFGGKSFWQLVDEWLNLRQGIRTRQKFGNEGDCNRWEPNRKGYQR